MPADRQAEVANEALRKSALAKALPIHLKGIKLQKVRALQIERQDGISTQEFQAMQTGVIRVIGYADVHALDWNCGRDWAFLIAVPKIDDRTEYHWIPGFPAVKQEFKPKLPQIFII